MLLFDPESNMRRFRLIENQEELRAPIASRRA